MAASLGGLDPDDVEMIPGYGQIALTPVIHDLLRTRYCIPHTILLVEKLQISPVSLSGRWRAVMVLLGDGKLCIQAILGGGLHRLVETGRIAVGAYVRLDDFYIRSRQLEEKVDGKPSKVAYLVVEDLVTVGWNKSFQNAWRQQVQKAEQRAHHEVDLDLEEENLEYTASDVDKAQQGKQPRQRTRVATHESDEEEDAFEDISTTHTSRTLPTRPAKSALKTSASTSRTKSLSFSSAKPQIIAMPRDWHDPQTPLKLTTLRSIPLLPYAQNWTCNVLGIVASLAEVETSHLPPYKQRVARIADPSTSKRVHLTVFLEPDAFTPTVGSAVLLVGVKNHRFDGGSLKKYASDKVPAQWWFENPTHLGWCDIQGLRQWWDDVSRNQNT